MDVGKRPLRQYASSLDLFLRVGDSTAKMPPPVNARMRPPRPPKAAGTPAANVCVEPDEQGQAVLRYQRHRLRVPGSGSQATGRPGPACSRRNDERAGAKRVRQRRAAKTRL